LSKLKTYPLLISTYPQLYPLFINSFKHPSTQSDAQVEMGIYLHLASEIIFGY